MHEKWHELLVQVDWESFSEKIRKIVDSLSPSDNELALVNAISYPVKSHIDALGTFRLNGI